MTNAEKCIIVKNALASICKVIVDAGVLGKEIKDKIKSFRALNTWNIYIKEEGKNINDIIDNSYNYQITFDTLGEDVLNEFKDKLHHYITNINDETDFNNIGDGDIMMYNVNMCCITALLYQSLI